MSEWDPRRGLPFCASVSSKETPLKQSDAQRGGKQRFHGNRIDFHFTPSSRKPPENALTCPAVPCMREHACTESHAVMLNTGTQKPLQKLFGSLNKCHSDAMSVPSMLPSNNISYFQGSITYTAYFTEKAIPECIAINSVKKWLQFCVNANKNIS